ncbi:hypothetical protein [Paenibacillus sp. FSL L8-0709]|uniref:hypothetical protein n=1 Tax=Paenibacillus sp. FSL L8-0709 TaxID=2975312 RepID=UPI0030FA584A
MSTENKPSLSDQVTQLKKTWENGIPAYVPVSAVAVLLAALKVTQQERDDLLNMNLRVSADRGDIPEIINTLQEHVGELENQLKTLKESSL